MGKPEPEKEGWRVLWKRKGGGLSEKEKSSAMGGPQKKAQRHSASRKKEDPVLTQWLGSVKH